MTDNVETTTGLDTAEAASLISDLITDDLMVGDQTPGPGSQSPTDEKAQSAQAEEGDEGANPSAETQSEDDDGEGAEEGSKEGEEDEASRQDEEDDENQPSAAEKFTVKIDGKDVEVDRNEVIAGYQRQADYTRKTQDLSKEKQAFDEVRGGFEQERQAVTQERGQYKALLGQLQTVIDQMMPQEPDWAELFARDKNEFLLARDQWRELQAQKQAAAAELERVKHVEAAEGQKALQKHIARGHAQLQEWEPKWKDPKVLRDDFAATVDYAKNTLGYTDQELAQANDHRALFAVHKARLYDELMAKAKNVKQQAAKSGGKKVLPAGSGNRVVQTGTQRSKQDGLKRLVKGGGRVEDAAHLLENMLEL